MERSPKSLGRSEVNQRIPNTLRASNKISRPARCGAMARAAYTGVSLGRSPARRTSPERLRATSSFITLRLVSPAPAQQIANRCHSKTRASPGRRSFRATGVKWKAVAYRFITEEFIRRLVSFRSKDADHACSPRVGCFEYRMGQLNIRAGTPSYIEAQPGSHIVYQQARRVNAASRFSSVEPEEAS